MQIVISGAGVVGFQIARQLIAEGKDVVLIEKDPVRAKNVSNHLDCIVINEDGNNPDTLKRAGIMKADFFISVTDSDEVNMIACGIVSSEFDVPVKIARVRNLDYSKANIINKTFLGIDFIVNSEVETSKVIADTVEHGALGDVMLFANSDVQLRNVVASASPFVGQSVKDIKHNLQEPFLIAALQRGEDVVIPYGDTLVQDLDNVYLLGNASTMEKVFKKLGKPNKRIEKVVIVGGGRIGTLVAEYLIERGKRITIIENDYEHCKILSERYPDSLVINADISDEGIFDEERLDLYDLIITATNNQELNILTSIYAKSLGTKRAVALVTKSNYLPIASQLGIDVTVSPKISTVDAVMKFIRRGNIKTVHSIFDGHAEVIEFFVADHAPIAGKKIRELTMPDHSLILSIRRKELNIIPDGETVINSTDTVITIAKKDSIAAMEELFLP